MKKYDGLYIFAGQAKDDVLEGQIAKAVAEVNASVQSFKHISYFVIRKEEFSKTTTKKIKRKGVAEESKDEYLRKLAGMN